MALQGTPTVSVIVPNYNHAPYLNLRIDSILSQTYQDFELILLDDCSTDHSREILRTYAHHPKVKLEFNAENSGNVYEQWRKGLEMARGRYAWIAESDDYAEPAFLARTVEILEAQADVMYVSCRSWDVVENERRAFAGPYLDLLDDRHWTKDFIVDGREECRRYFVLTNPVPNASAVVFRKDAYERVGLDRGYKVCADYKIWASLALQGKVAYIAEPLNNYRSHRQNVRTRSLSGALDVAEFFYAMLSVLQLVASRETLLPYHLTDETLHRMPYELGAQERIGLAQKILGYAMDWNLRHNHGVPRSKIRDHFKEWEFALAGRGFAICAPSRWQFFVHRCHFFWHYFPKVSWKQRILNLLRLFGAPVVGYRHRHWPEQKFSKIARLFASPRQS